MTDEERADGRDGNVLYSPPEWAPVPGAMYPRVARLDRDGGDGTTLLATFECYETTGKTGTDEPYFPIYRSTDDGRTWSRFSELRDTQRGWGLRYQPMLFEAPRRIGPWDAGTVFAVSNSIPNDRSRTSIDLYASEDGGRNWSYVSTVAAGGKAVPGRGESPVWAPELAVDADGNLVCYFSDARHSDDGYNRLIGHRVSKDGGRTWEPETFDVAIADDESTPGMPTITTLPTGRYLLTYFIGGPKHGGSVFVKTSPDGREWGAPADAGSPVRADDGRQFIEGPYATWVPYGGEDGTILVAGKTLRDRNRNPVPESGTVLLASTDLTGRGPWKPISAPLWYDDELETGHRSVGWTTALLPSADGTSLLQLTSTYTGHGKTEIRYARAPLESLFDDDHGSSDRSGERSSHRHVSDHPPQDTHRLIRQSRDSARSAESHHVKSIVKAFGLLEALEQTGEVGVTELSRQTGIAKSSVYKYLDTLRHLGYVTKSDGNYSASLRLFHFGQRILSRYEVYQIAQPELDALSEKIGEMVSLIVEEDGDAVYLYCTSPHDAQTIEEGSRMPIHLSTGGKAILSYRSREYVEDVLEDTAFDIDRQNFRADLQKARDNRVIIDQNPNNQLEYNAGLLEKRWHSFGQQRVDDQIYRIAVPIRDVEDRGVAAIEVIGFEFSLNSRRLQEELVPLLVSAGKSIETDLLSE
ncbi:IclR family transcriptional regulator domain-containing protein [Halosolutus gelatinilyticus]|uniref:IclR family transcriptional regulator domain-containing protein n=1 Tax=Halosolutus gelatinilyticus TaxID=2931975 RepID=UPI001FF1F2B7|nr:helix-turn-helix domain-containing protein [Halosolutus gelatinilyticus]